MSEPTREGVVQFYIELKVTMEQLKGWEPDRIDAFFRGISLVQRAINGAGFDGSSSGFTRVPLVDQKEVLKRFLTDNGPSCRPHILKATGIPSGSLSAILRGDKAFQKTARGRWELTPIPANERDTPAMPHPGGE